MSIMKQTIDIYPISLRRRKKGSTILLVLSILSVLILLSIMMTFTSRLEQAAAGHFARGTQDRSSAQTGLAPLLPALSVYMAPGATSPLDLSFNKEFIEHRFESLDGGESPFGRSGIVTVPSDSIIGSANGIQIASAGGLENPLRFSGPTTGNNDQFQLGSNENDFTSPLDESGSAIRAREEIKRVQSETDPAYYEDDQTEAIRQALLREEELRALETEADSEDVVTGFGKGFGLIGSEEYLPQVITPTGEVFIQDASALVNINVASFEHLQETLSIAATEFNHGYDPNILASAILDLRFGQDNAPGFAGVDDDYDADDTVSLGESFDEETEKKHSRSFVDQGSKYFESLTPEKLRKIESALEEVNEPLGVYSQDEFKSRQIARHGLLSGVDEYDEYVADIRNEPYGDDIRIDNLMDLLYYPETAASGITADEIRELNMVLTVFSASARERVLDGKILSMIDINRASAEEIYRSLKLLYGEGNKNDVLLRQFAVNIIDARDTDSIPTEFPGGTAASKILGVERTPLITEVYADSRTPVEFGDDGQFVELYNPWTDPIRLSGWHLRGAGLNVMLSGTIPPQGYLVITDDLDGSVLDSGEDDLAGTGSFYDVFGMLPDGLRRQILVSPSLSIVDQGSRLTIELENEDGNIVDEFTWSSTEQDEDSLYSYQRRNPVIRESIRASATPFNDLSAGGMSLENLDRLAQGPQNGPFVSVADILTVFAGFSDPALNVSQLDAFPIIGTNESADEDVAELARDRTTLDGRLMDIFDVFSSNPNPGKRNNDSGDILSDSKARLEQNEGVPLIMTTIERLEKARALRVEPENMEAAKTLSEDVEYLKYLKNEASGQQPITQFGRINLNTAGPLALQSIPGIDESIALRLVQRRDEMIAQTRRGGMNDAILFHEISDILIDEDIMYQARTDAERIMALRRLLPHITLNSQTFRVVTQPRVDQDTTEEAQMIHRMEGLVTKDRLMGEVVYFRELF